MDTRSGRGVSTARDPKRLDRDPNAVLDATRESDSRARSVSVREGHRDLVLAEVVGLEAAVVLPVAICHGDLEAARQLSPHHQLCTAEEVVGRMRRLRIEMRQEGGDGGRRLQSEILLERQAAGGVDEVVPDQVRRDRVVEAELDAQAARVSPAELRAPE